MSRKHNLKLKRPLKEKIRITLRKEKISLKNKKTEINSISRIYCKSIPNKAAITINKDKKNATHNKSS
jgi:hypothetical protein